MSCRNGPALEKLIRAHEHSQKLLPCEIQLRAMYGEMIEIDEERTTTQNENDRLMQELNMVENEITALERKEQDTKNDFDDEVQFILFDYLPSHPYNYSHAMGPVDYDIAETETTIGVYDIGTYLGEGGFASVYVGTNRCSQEMFALKLLSKHRMVSLRALTQLQNELDVLRSLKHENIIKLHDSIHAPNHIYIVMELGHTNLFHYIQNQDDVLSLDTVREIALGMIRGVAYLHERGIAHLDIKEENILIATDVTVEDLSHSHIKLCDLGLCAVQSDIGQPIPVDRLCGTRGFYAPEIVCHIKSADGRSADMWSVGATLISILQLVTSSWRDAYSYVDQDWHKFQKGLVGCVVELYQQSSFPDFDLHDLICRLLVMKPSERLTAAEALEHVWMLQKSDYSDDCQDLQKFTCTKDDYALPSWYKNCQKRRSSM